MIRDEFGGDIGAWVKYLKSRHKVLGMLDAMGKNGRSAARRAARGRWHQMWARCTKPEHPAWKNYGGRGITVCDRWSDLDAYIDDVGLPPDPYATLDRINNDGNYEPGNVRWASRSVQNRNKRASCRG